MEGASCSILSNLDVISSDSQPLNNPDTAAQALNAALETRNPDRIAETVNQVLSANGAGMMRVSGWMVAEALKFMQKLGLRVTVVPEPK